MDAVEDLNPRTACDLSKFFWIDWNDRTISVGEGELVGIGQFMTYVDPEMPPVKRFMISTGFGDAGEWNLGKLTHARIYTGNKSKSLAGRRLHWTLCGILRDNQARHKRID